MIWCNTALVTFFLIAIKKNDAQEYNGDTNVQKTWMHLSDGEIVTFIDKDLQTSLNQFAVNVSPTILSADDPLNAFVGASEFFEKGDPIILTILQEALMEQGYSTEKHKLLYQSLKKYFLEKTVDEALELRQKKLIDQQAWRVEKLINNYLKHLESNALDNQLETLEPEEMTNRILQVLQNYSTAKEINRVFGYPIMEDEIRKAIGNTDESMYANVVQAITPFLREGIYNQDKYIISKYSSERSVDHLVQSFQIPIKTYFNDCLLRASKYDRLMTSIFDDSHDLTKEIMSEYWVLWHRALTQAMHDNPSLHLETETSSLTRKQVQKNIRLITSRNADVVLYQMAARKISNIINFEFDFSHLLSFKKLEEILYQKCKALRDEQYSSYIKLHGAFTKQNAALLSGMASTMLDRDYTALQTEEFENATFRFNDYFIYHRPARKEDRSRTSLEHFNEELEKHAYDCCGFPKGSFTFSISYYKVLKLIFPSLKNPFGAKSSVLAQKNEL